MAHHIQCIIGDKQIMTLVANKFNQTQLIDLKDGISVIPLTEELIIELNDDQHIKNKLAHEEFEKLYGAVDSLLREHSHKQIIGYIETEYFGGSGIQNAISYLNGKILKGPLQTETKWDEISGKYIDVPSGERAINAVLKDMGIKNTKNLDSFDQIGLGRYRSNDRLIKSL